MCSKRALALDLLCSKNIIVAQIIERPIHGGSGVIFQSNCSVGRRILFKVVKPLSRLRSGLAGTLVLFLSAFVLTACIVTGDQSIESNPKDPRAQDIADKIGSIDLLPRSATLVGLDEQTALIREPDVTWRVAGAGAVTLYDGRQTTVVGHGSKVERLTV